ncbi:MAG: thiamine phosphate synthase [Chthoniobacterales bacterium]
MKSLGDARLYAILDLGYVAPDDALNASEQLIRGGADLIQLRAKKQSAEAVRQLAIQLHRLTSAAGVPLIINDHPEIARDVPVEGLHVGQDDLALAAARAIVRREDCWFGKSTHSVAQAVAAQAEGADYIGFGPLFATPTKPDYMPIGIDEIRRVHELVRLPIFCIGGIKLANLPEVLAAGAKRAVIVSGLLQNADIAAATRAAKSLFQTDQQSEISNQK